jgi:hypothetical protein
VPLPDAYVRLRQKKPNQLADACFWPRVFTDSFAPFGPALTLSPRLLAVSRTPGSSFFDFRNPNAIATSG